MSEFLEMGGYAQYVWSSFGLTLVVLVGNVIAARALLGATLKSLGGRLRREQRSRR